jgi:hypothetical protein
LQIENLLHSTYKRIISGNPDQFHAGHLHVHESGNIELIKVPQQIPGYTHGECPLVQETLADRWQASSK